MLEFHLLRLIWIYCQSFRVRAKELLYWSVEGLVLWLLKWWHVPVWACEGSPHTICSKVNQPHYGYNFGPASPMHCLSFWSIHDTTVLHKAGKAADGNFLPDRSSQKSGWFYRTVKSTTAKWAAILKTDAQQYSINFHETMLCDCWQYSKGLGVLKWRVATTSTRTTFAMSVSCADPSSITSNFTRSRIQEQRHRV